MNDWAAQPTGYINHRIRNGHIGHHCPSLPTTAKPLTSENHPKALPASLKGRERTPWYHLASDRKDPCRERDTSLPPGLDLRLARRILTVLHRLYADSRRHTDYPCSSTPPRYALAIGWSPASAKRKTPEHLDGARPLAWAAQ